VAGLPFIATTTARRDSDAYELAGQLASTPTKTIGKVMKAAPSKTQNLHQYVAYRAKAEGLPYDLDAEFFDSHFVRGVRQFFGVTLDDQGKIVSDDQNPVALAAYRSITGRRVPVVPVVDRSAALRAGRRSLHKADANYGDSSYPGEPHHNTVHLPQILMSRPTMPTPGQVNDWLSS
jgi:hypothetical protein